MDASSFALTILGFLVTINVVMTLAAIRRLRELDEPSHTAQPSGLPATGVPIGEFHVNDLTGKSLSHTDFRGASRVVFLLPGCGPCEEIRKGLHTLPDTNVPLVVAVLADEAKADARAIIADLPVKARVVAGMESAAQVAKAIGVTAYPAVITIVDGVVAGASMRLASASNVSLDGSPRALPHHSAAGVGA